MARILVVDDDPEQVALQQKLLEAFGHHVTPSVCAAEALRQLTQCRPDLIVVDLRLPSAYDGLALLRAIRGAGCRVPIILQSGWPDDIYGTPEEKMVSRVLLKGSIRELLAVIAELFTP